MTPLQKTQDFEDISFCVSFVGIITDAEVKKPNGKLSQSGYVTKYKKGII